MTKWLRKIPNDNLPSFAVLLFLLLLLLPLLILIPLPLSLTLLLFLDPPIFLFALYSPLSLPPPPHTHTHTHKHTQVEERIECVVSGKVRYSKREDKLLALPVPMETATNKSGSAAVEQNELGEEGGSRREGEEDHLHCLSSCM